MMPSLLSFQKGNVTGFNLDALPSWRLQLGITTIPERASYVPCLALVLAYSEPLAVQQGGVGQVALLRAICPVAGDPNDLKPAAAVGLMGGTLDLDLERLREALYMFKNNPQVKGDVLERTIEDAQKLVRAYWEVRQWMVQGAREEKEFRLDDQALLLMRP